MQRYQIEIEGMGCDHCIQAVSSAFLALGAELHEVKIGSADISFAGDQSALHSAVEDAGFEVVSIAAV